MSKGRIEFTLQEAEHLLGFKHVIAKDADRPTLQHIQFTVEGGDLQVVATDSYRLGLVRFGENVDERERFIEEKGGGPSDVVVPFADLERFIKAAVASAKARNIKTRDRWHKEVILIAETDGIRDITFEAPLFGLAATARLGDFRYPNWKQLMPADASDELSGEVKLSAFSSLYLSEMHKFIYPVAGMAGKGKQIPVQQLAVVGQTELKPWLFRWRSMQLGIRKDYLLMPVRL